MGIFVYCRIFTQLQCSKLKRTAAKVDFFNSKITEHTHVASPSHEYILLMSF